eukprot:2447-Lingulodinium_polyedra.AAC.1
MSIEWPLSGHRASTGNRTKRTANNRPNRPKASLNAHVAWSDPKSNAKKRFPASAGTQRGTLFFYAHAPAPRTRGRAPRST